MLSSLNNSPVPVLLNFESDYRRLKQYQEENDRLKQQVSQDMITSSVCAMIDSNSRLAMITSTVCAMIDSNSRLVII